MNETRSLNGHLIDTEEVGNVEASRISVNGIRDDVRKRAAQETQPLQTEQNLYADLLAKAEVKTTDFIPRPPVCFSIERQLPGAEYQRSTIGTLGNFLVVIGKAKSRKTFLVSCLVAAVISMAQILKRITGTLPFDQSTVLFFDTEQSRFHVQRVLQRICSLCGKSELPNLKMFSLRPFETTTRLEAIRWAIYNTENLGVVVVDGIRDLVFSINGEEEATRIVTDLLKWTEERNIHLVTVVHQNKADTNARGHLGSELINKAETVISVTRDPQNKDISIVAPEMCRDKEFEEFAFAIDDQGLPFFIEGSDSQSSGSNTKGQSKATKPTPNSTNVEIHQAILQKAFSQSSQLSYAELKSQLQVCGEYFGVDIASNRAANFITYYRNEKYINSYKANGERYPTNELNPDRFNNQSV